MNYISSLINLNTPGHYFNVSILTISVANLVLILIMIAVFGLALILPFPKAKIIKPTEIDVIDKSKDDSSDDMWTAKLRKLGLRLLPPSKLIPDSQPAYVSSWIYVFGVATIAALIMIIFSGLALAIGGPDWWHTTAVGHFINSVHLWSVELFMAFMVIHLWGKFWIAAWRGKRTLTWITGVVAFLASIVEAFTGYLSQQNFSSQWISTNGKDAINSLGIGSFFNLMNFGQMLMWHILLIPSVLILVIAVHVILVRIRGVSHPLPVKRPKTKKDKVNLTIKDSQEWRGAERRYDILKEGFFAVLIVFALVIALATLLSSPDKPPVTIRTWSKIAPADFMGTVVSELSSTSETANYGPPYNNGRHNVQKILVSWQLLGGVREPINTAKDFVLQPLTKLSFNNEKLSVALKEYETATVSQQIKWNKAYNDVLPEVKFVNNNPIIPKANDGPVPIIVSSELMLARSGAIDEQLLSQQQFYGSNYTKPLLFIEDGNYFSLQAKKDHLIGSQWGVMNETGNYPGQPWMWLYTLWYQLPQFSTSGNVDLIAVYLTAVSTALLLFVPFIPGLRDIPSIIPIHKVIYRKWHKGKV